jgi:HPt (histidine-containing phosphotransfer) domain-containing protein
MVTDGFEAGAEFDFGRLDEISGGDRDFEQDLAGEYLSQSWELLAEFARALEGRDAAAMRRPAHTLKGSSQTIGAVGVGRLAAELERLAGEPVLSLAVATLDRTRRSLTATEHVLDRHFGSDGYRRAA